MSFSNDFAPPWHLARNPLKNVNFPMEHVFSRGPAPPRRCQAKLMAFTARGKPEIRQIGRADWVDDRPESATSRSVLGPEDERARRPI